MLFQKKKMIKAAVLRNLPKSATKDLAMQLKDVKTVNEVRNIMKIYFHDHQPGMLRGRTGPMICFNAEENNKDGDTTIHSKANSGANNTSCTGASKEDIKEIDNGWQGENDLNAAYKGNNKGKKGSKGYGECWHCGGWGHPRRECPHFNEFTTAKGAITTLKGGKSGGGKGKKVSTANMVRAKAMERANGEKDITNNTGRQVKELETDSMH